MTTLKPGDRAYFLSKSGLKLRCTVVEALDFGKTRGEDLWVPIVRQVNRKNRVNLDNPDNRVKPPQIRWKKRTELRKLPS